MTHPASPARAPLLTDRERQVFDDIKRMLREMMPDVSDGDCITICRVLVRVLWHDGPTLQELKTEHLSDNRAHGDQCSCCGYLDAALYSEATGRPLSQDWLRAKVRS